MTHTWWIYALLSAFFAALTALFVRLGVKGMDPDLATAIRVVIILILTWCLVLAKKQSPDFGQISPRNWIFIILSGLATGLSWIFYFRAMQKGQAGTVAMIDKLSVPLILILAAFFLHEPITWKTGLAALLIVSGTFLVIS